MLPQVRARIVGEVVLACVTNRARPSFANLAHACAHYPTVVFVEAMWQLEAEEVLVGAWVDTSRCYSLADRAVRGCSYD